MPSEPVSLPPQRSGAGAEEARACDPLHHDCGCYEIYDVRTDQDLVATMRAYDLCSDAAAKRAFFEGYAESTIRAGRNAEVTTLRAQLAEARKEMELMEEHMAAMEWCQEALYGQVATLQRTLSSTPPAITRRNAREALAAAVHPTEENR